MPRKKPLGVLISFYIKEKDYNKLVRQAKRQGFGNEVRHFAKMKFLIGLKGGAKNEKS